VSGHSKWSKIKRQKSAEDARRGKIFGKLVRKISVAARNGGDDPEFNHELRNAIDEAKSYNMPNDTIERAILHGTGQLDGVNYEQIVYEGYGPGGAALIIDILTDNRNRTISEIRHILDKNGGNLGERGCVAWIFDKRGIIIVDKDNVDEEEVFMLALEAGAEDIKTEDEEQIEIICQLEEFADVKNALEEADIEPSVSEISMLPKTTIRVEGKDAEKLMRLIDELEEHDDVQKVYSNFDIPEDIMEKAA